VIKLFGKEELIIIIDVLQRMILIHIEKGIKTDDAFMAAYYKGKEDNCRDIKQFFEDRLMEIEGRVIN